MGDVNQRIEATYWSPRPMKNSQRVESPEGVDLIPSRDGRIRTGDFLLPIQDACLLTGSQMSRSHHPVEKAMAPVPVRDARQSFPPFDGVFSPFKHGSIRHGRTARTADRAVLVELRRFLAGVHAHWDVPDVHSPISTGPRRSAFKIRLQGAVSSAMSRSRGSSFLESRICGGRSARRSA